MMLCRVPAFLMRDRSRYGISGRGRRGFCIAWEPMS